MLNQWQVNVGWQSATQVQLSPDVVLRSLVYWVATDNTCRATAGQTHLLVGHCLRRLPNFNPNRERNASFFLAREKHLPASSSHTQSTGQPSGGGGCNTVTALVAPASQTMCQHYIRWASIKPTFVQGFVLAVLSYNGLGQYWAIVCESDGSLYNWSTAPICWVSCSSLYTCTRLQPAWGQHSRRWANIDLILYFIIRPIKKKNNNKI